MGEHAPAPEAAELVYVAEPSWVPLFVAAGLMIVLMAIFTWWVYGLLGLALAVPSARAWARASDDSVTRLPRRQRTTTAVLPAVPPKRPAEQPRS